jgi:hypothetical protein
VLFESSAFDTQGNYLNPTDYIVYPGQLTSVNPAGAILTINNFTGSRVDGNETPYVGSIIFTASIDGLSEFETVYRLEDGENAPGLFVTSDANQFVYKATDLSPNPINQTITFLAKRKNLASTTTPIIINSGSVPPLTLLNDDAGTGVSTFSLSIGNFSYNKTSTSASYYFTASDEFGNEQYDSITLSQVKILDGLSVTLTNDNASLPALSTGFVPSGSFVLTSGSVTVKVGNENIDFDDDNDSVRASNTFAITNLSGTGCTPNGGNGSNPLENVYGITSLESDSGSLNITVNYKDGAGDETTIVKTVTYTKNKKAAPVLEITSSPKDQSVTAKSTGGQIDFFSNVTVAVRETYNGVTTLKPLTSLIATSSDISNILTTSTTGLVTLNGRTLVDGINSTTVLITAVVTDSEGISRTLTDTLSLSKVKKAVPNVVISATPQAQSVLANSSGGQTGTLSNVTVGAFEGATPVFTSMVITSSAGFSTPPNVSGTTLTMTSAVMDAAEGSVTLTVTHTDSEGSGGQTQTIIVRFTKVNVGADGEDGEDGIDGVNGLDGLDGLDGASGPGIVFRGVWDASVEYFDTDDVATRRDAVLYNNIYYATLPNVTTNLNKRPDLNTGTFWESLGAGDFFVAAKIAIFEESFVQNTINVGTNTGGNANITIAGGTTSPFISIGQSIKGYDQIGAFMGSDGTNGKLSLKSATNSLLWDGAALTINGSGTFSGALSAASGTFTGALEGGTISIGSGSSIFRATTQGIWLGNTSFDLAPFRVSPAGALTATSGTVGGVTIASNKIYIGAGNYNNADTGFYVDNSGNFSLKDKLTWNGTTLSINGNGTFSGALSAATGTFNGSIRIGSGTSVFTADTNGIYLGSETPTSAPFRVTPGGALTATSGNIAGWVIDPLIGLTKTTGDYILKLDSTNQRISITKTSSIPNDDLNVVVLDASEDIPDIAVSDTASLDYAQNNVQVALNTGTDINLFFDTGYELANGGTVDYNTGIYGIIGLAYASEEILVERDNILNANITNVISTTASFNYFLTYDLTIRVRQYPTYNDAVNETNQNSEYGTKELLVASRQLSNFTGTPIDDTQIYDTTIPAFGGGGFNTQGPNLFYRVELRQVWTGIIVGGESGNLRFRRPVNTINVKYGRVSNGFSILSPGGLQVYQGFKNYASFKAPSATTGDNSNFMLIKGKSQIVGSLNVSATFSAASKQFKIQHPIDEDRWLYHTSIESPRADLIYRGVIQLMNGVGTISIDSASNMMSGTYVALTKNQQLFLQNESGFDRVIGTVIDGIVSITSENPISTDAINWMVIAERNDIEILQSPLYNSDGNYKPERYKKEYIDAIRNEYISSSTDFVN